MVPSPTLVALVVAIAGTLAFAWYAGGGRWRARVSDRLLYGIPWGTLVIVGINVVSTFYLLIVPALQDMDPALEEVSRIHGASIPGTLRSVTLPLIKALDAFLIGIILTIFSFGVYDFFVSELEPAEEAGVRPDWLKFESVGELKNKIIEVVLVILAIQFFELMKAHASEFSDPYMYLIVPVGTAILAVSIGFFKWSTH